MKSILFLLYNFPNIGGIEQATTVIANELSKLYKVRILSVHSFLEKQPLLNEVIGCDSFPKDALLAEMIAHYNQYIEEHSIDVVINQGAYGGFNPMVFNPLRLRNCKIISVLHGVPMHELIGAAQVYRELTLSTCHGLKKYRRLLKLQFGLFKGKKEIILEASANHRLVSKESDALVLLSPGYIDEYKRGYKVTHINRVVSIHNPIIWEKENVLSIKKKEKIVLFVGRLTNYDKRIDRLLKVWSKIEERHPEWQLRILGDGPDRQMLEELHQRLNLKNCTFLGFGDPTEEYRKASIVALTSQMECLPMALIEGQQFGCVPIAFGCSKGILDILNRGKAGVIIRPYSISAYTQGLSLLMSNTAFRTELSKQAQDDAKRFDSKTIAHRWATLIESLLGRDD